jgi:hypothetical protein
VSGLAPIRGMGLKIALAVSSRALNALTRQTASPQDLRLIGLSLGFDQHRTTT